MCFFLRHIKQITVRVCVCYQSLSANMEERRGTTLNLKPITLCLILAGHRTNGARKDGIGSTQACNYLKPVRRSNASDMLSWSFREGQDRYFGMRTSPTLWMNSLVQLETRPSDTPNSAAVARTPAPCPNLYKAIAVRSHGWNDGPRPPSAARTSRVPYSSKTRALKVVLLSSVLRHRTSNEMGSG